MFKTYAQVEFRLQSLKKMGGEYVKRYIADVLNYII